MSQRGSRMAEGQSVRAGDVRRRFVVGMLVVTVGLLNASGVVFASVPLTPGASTDCPSDDCRAGADSPLPRRRLPCPLLRRRGTVHGLDTDFATLHTSRAATTGTSSSNT